MKSRFLLVNLVKFQDITGKSTIFLGSTTMVSVLLVKNETAGCDWVNVWTHMWRRPCNGPRRAAMEFFEVSGIPTWVWVNTYRYHF